MIDPMIAMFGGRQVGQWNSIKGLTYSLRYQSVSKPVAFANKSLVVTTILVSYTQYCRLLFSHFWTSVTALSVAAYDLEHYRHNAQRCRQAFFAVPNVTIHINA